MKTGRPKQTLKLTDDARADLEAFARSRSLPHGLVQRAKIILLASQGESNTLIAEKLKISKPTVGMWRRRYLDYGLEGLHDEMKSGRPRTISDEQVAMVVRKTLRSKPKGGTHWAVRPMAETIKISKSTVHRIWNAFALQPHRQKSFKLSNDPFFVEKVRDIVGLYLSPPKNAMVLCVDEKSQIQALDRTQPILPMGLGYVEGVTHDYIRHGTTTLFAALDIVTGGVIAQCKKKHRHQDFLGFLKHVEQQVPDDLEIHAIVDNYATHKHKSVKGWLARHPRWHIHYTPTYSSWLNQVEIWFNIITQKAIRRGTFSSVKELVTKIQKYVDSYNRYPRPFAWTATADSILAKVQRLCQRISGTQH
jgi:putative transposase